MGQRLWHMTEAKVWRSCVESQRPYFPATYEQDGFIHLTADPNLLLTVANHFYTSSQGNWVVLVLDSSKLTAEVKLEPAAPVGDTSSSGLLSGEGSGAPQQPDGQQQAAAQQGQREGEPAASAEPLFPHLYGTIDFAAVVCQLAMERSADGRFLGIEGVPRDDSPYADFT